MVARVSLSAALINWIVITSVVAEGPAKFEALVQRNTKNCLDPPFDSGTCHGSEKRWSYSATVGACKSFNFTGCGTLSKNIFLTEHDCNSTCKYAACFLDYETYTCLKPGKERWYFSHFIGACLPYLPEQCGANANKFETEQDCYKTCSNARCSMLPDRRSASCASTNEREHFGRLIQVERQLRWFMNQTSKRCDSYIVDECILPQTQQTEPFIYNQTFAVKYTNRFYTEAECTQLCLCSDKLKNSTLPLCQQPREIAKPAAFIPNLIDLQQAISGSQAAVRKPDEQNNWSSPLPPVASWEQSQQGFEIDRLFVSPPLPQPPPPFVAAATWLPPFNAVTQKTDQWGVTTEPISFPPLPFTFPANFFLPFNNNSITLMMPSASTMKSTSQMPDAPTFAMGAYTATLNFVTSSPSYHTTEEAVYDEYTETSRSSSIASTTTKGVTQASTSTTSTASTLSSEPPESNEDELGRFLGQPAAFSTNNSSGANSALQSTAERTPAPASTATTLPPLLTSFRNNNSTLSDPNFNHSVLPSSQGLQNNRPKFSQVTTNGVCRFGWMMATLNASLWFIVVLTVTHCICISTVMF